MRSGVSQNFTNVSIIFFGRRKDTVKISMETFVKRFQPDKYHKWINGMDVGPHPEDNKKKRYETIWKRS